MAKNTTVRIGLISRIDYGSKGFRRALIDMAFSHLQKEGTHFNVLAGGLVSAKDLRRELKYAIADATSGIPAAEKPLAREEAIDSFFEKRARELAKIIPENYGPDPENKDQKKLIDLFVITSPAFDGEIGETILHYLTDIRPDIRPWGVGSGRLEIKYANQIIWVLTPVKGVWMRGDYYSTSAERVIKDKIKQTAQSSPDIYVIGCFASAIHKPKGELKYEYVTVPACHRLEETRVSENQIGVAILDVNSLGKHLFNVLSLKDQVAKELSFIIPPKRTSKVQKGIVSIIKHRGFTTRGIARVDLGVTDEDINKAIEGLLSRAPFGRKGENWPGVYVEEGSRRYYFDLNYIQNKLKYENPSGSLNIDRLISFSCLHAGSVETDYKFFVNVVPEIILRTGADYFINVGDTKEGLKHDLMAKGEIVAGMNSTDQEKFAANLIATVLMKVFSVRFMNNISQIRNGNSEDLIKIIKSSLPVFNYILGNHDLWEKSDGHDPLELFKEKLINKLLSGINRILLNNKLPNLYIEDLIRGEKVVSALFFELPSGLKVSLQHPHMARAKTTSLRPQEMLDYAKRYGCQVAIGGNFHVSETVAEWDMDLGQCVCQELGTIKHGSNFERNKMKMVDQGVGFLKISSKDKRIIAFESFFEGGARAVPPVDNKKIINRFITSDLGVDPID